MSHPAASGLPTADMTTIALGSVLMTVCAWLSIPLPPVPITLQTFALFMVLALLGGRRGLYVTLVYLLLGAIGLPVFSGFQGGVGVLLGASGGFLLSFPMSAALYWLVTARIADRPSLPFFAGGLSLLACYSGGCGWYLWLYAPSNETPAAVLQVCVLPFLIPDILKLTLAVLLARRLKNAFPPHV